MLLLIIVGVIVAQLRLRGLRHERQGKGFTREKFINAFHELGVPDDIPAAVYDYYTSQKAWKDFPFYPDDAYSEVLHDDPEDLDRDALALIQRLEMLLLPERILREYGDKPIKTLRDMVLWLDWVRQNQPAASKSAR